MNNTSFDYKLILSFGYFLSSMESSSYRFDEAIPAPNYLVPLAFGGISLLLFVGLPLFFWRRNQQSGNDKGVPVDPASVFPIRADNELLINQNTTDLLKQLVNISETGIPEKHANTLIERGKVEPILVDLLYKTLQPDLIPNKIRKPSSAHSIPTHIDQVFLKKIFSIIEENLSNEQLSLTLLSESAGVSVTHLNRKLKCLIGLSGGKLIRSIRLNKAAKILTDQSMTISEVAYLMGFKEPTHFTRSFKKQFGVPPSEYVKQ